MRVLIGYPRSFAGARLAAAVGEHHEVLVPDVDLRDQSAAQTAFDRLRPQALILDTPFSGGIALNMAQPADLLFDNLEAQTHALRGARRYGVERVVFLGSSCMYPREGAEMLSESWLGREPLEPTNRAYATAKLAGWQLCAAIREQEGHAWVTVVPANLYGPGDDFDPASGHVVGALLRRFHEARERGDREVMVWGSGRPVRDFLHIDDLARFVALALEVDLPWAECNVGSGTGCSIAELARAVAETVGYRGEIRFDASRPDGMPRKVLDNRRALSTGWRPRIDLREGLADAYAAFRSAKPSAAASDR